MCEEWRTPAGDLPASITASKRRASATDRSPSLSPQLRPHEKMDDGYSSTGKGITRYHGKCARNDGMHLYLESRPKGCMERNWSNEGPGRIRAAKGELMLN